MRRRPGRLGLASALLALLAAASPALAGQSDAAPGAAGGAAGGAPNATKRFVHDLYRRGDFVAQTNLVQCVGASMQMMLNMIRPTNDRTAATQKELFELARSLRDPNASGATFNGSGNGRRRGASARGWALGLTQLGAGPYTLRGEESLEAALAAAAHAIRRTGKPVGMLVWRGRHAWVMSGFEATGDPLTDADFRVTAVRVLDPLYPRDSRTWGDSPPPGTSLTTGRLARVFVPWRPNSRNVALRNKFVLVLPYVPYHPPRWQLRPA